MHNHNSAAHTSAEIRTRREEQQKAKKLMASLTSACLIFLVAGWIAEAHELGSVWLKYFLYTIAYLSGGYFASQKALEELREGSVNVDLLMILAAVGAALVNEWPEGGVLLFLFSLSGTLEQFVLGRTRKAIEALMDLSPEEAVLLEHGTEKKVPVEHLNIGDIIIVRPGERISADGKIILGESSVDQSVMTGESIPVEKKTGDSVFAGTMNQQGAIQVRVEKCAHETTLARIVMLVEEAQGAKASSERFTAWFGEKYTYFVLGFSTFTIALFYFFFQYPFGHALYKGMTVLVVASPCAVVISIPAAILSAIAAAARSGVLFKGGAHLEGIAGLQAIAFDKTGTLTIGKPQVVAIACAPGVAETKVLERAAAAEALSEHPLAKAVVQAASERGIAVGSTGTLQAIIGKGVIAELPSGTVLIGKGSLFLERGIVIPQELAKKADELREAGNTTIFIGEKDTVLGIVALADTLRKTAESSLKKLRALGLKHLVMLTGDNEAVAKNMADHLGVEFFAELLPEDKLKKVGELREKYHTVAMVGDGINDAPSLAAANLGISLGGAGTAVALETADIVLMADNLMHLPFAISLGRKANQIIKQNLIFAFGVMMTLLAGAFSTDLRLPFAVLGHEGSTVLVILNGLRLLASSPEDF